MKKAILIGATGLIGKALLTQLLDSAEYDEVRVFTRRKTGENHPKLREFIVDFNAIENAKADLVGDVLFSCLGTTLKTAGSKEAQYKIDFDMQFNTTKIAKENGVENMVLLSSAGANAKSSVFYSRMKGELDEAVEKLGFDRVGIIRPSMLAGDRKEFRWSEKIFTPIMYAFSWIPGIRKYRPIKDKTVAKAMINAVNDSAKSTEIYELEAVFKLAK
ncbi:oxidoreductase [Crocinitomix catalasitica]|uniref:oxidoreductase n=1 Tax=Crocinitomix catalasitica TaxID=184607 RepID=UPI000482770B|nr:oxidoreductase [Crocinitomix catalasitica]